MTGLVSIVIPVYNAQKHLGQCLDSLREQTYENLEIICVNDGSTDGSLSMLEDYASRDGRIHVFSKENEGKGAASARNMGLKQISGDYVLILDSDDFFEPDLVESVLDEALRTDADVVVYGADKYDDARERTILPYVSRGLEDAPAKMPFCWKDVPEKIFQIGDLMAWNKLYRANLIRENDLHFEAIAISDDQLLSFISMVMAKRISVVDRQLLHYRVNTGNSQTSGVARHPESTYLASYGIADKLKELGIYEDVKRSFLNRMFWLMREGFDKMDSWESLHRQHRIYLEEVLPRLDAQGLPAGYFYDPRIDEWYQMITHDRLEEIVFRSAAGYGAEWMTAILRFPLPYENLKKGSRIVLAGKGLKGHYWYAQLLLSGYCDVVLWVDSEKEIPAELKYDDILRAE